MAREHEHNKREQQSEFSGGPSAPEAHVEEEDEETDTAEEIAVPDSDLTGGIFSGKPDAAGEEEAKERRTD